MDTIQDDREAFGASVRRYRQMRGWEQDDLAGRLKRSVATISRIETGKQNVAVQDIKAIARVLQIPAAALLGEENIHPGGFEKILASGYAERGKKALSIIEEMVHEFENIGT